MEQLQLRTEAEILRRLARETQAAVANAAGMDPSVVSRVASGNMGIKLCQLSEFLAALGLRVVDDATHEIDPDELAALRVLAARYLSSNNNNNKG